MQLQIDIGVNQIIGLIKQLPWEQRALIKKELESDTVIDRTESRDADLTALLLSGPVMCAEEEKQFKQFNQEFDRWANNLFS